MFLTQMFLAGNLFIFICPYFQYSVPDLSQFETMILIKWTYAYYTVMCWKAPESGWKKKKIVQGTVKFVSLEQK